jgi:branched-chain amino acid transport system permease protein
MGFFLETLIGGLMTGMLYALVALGFVLIYKASGVFNFAQGAMVLFAALAMARFAEWIPKALHLDGKLLGNLLAFAAALVLMIAVAWLVERLVLGKLVNQEGVTLLMATLGISYFMDGFGQTLFGSDIYKIDIGLPKDPIFLLESAFQGGVLVNKEDLYAAAIAAALVILGGFTSVPGAIVGGLIIGLGEKVSEVYLGPLLGGGIENWFAYVLALVFLLFRPEGLFGEKIIERV